MTDEKQDLDNLLQHPGWHRITEQGLKEIEARMTTALANAANATDDVIAINQVRQCIAAKHALEAFLAWPAARLKILKDADLARLEGGRQLSRRGTL